MNFSRLTRTVGLALLLGTTSSHVESACSRAKLELIIPSPITVIDQSNFAQASSIELRLVNTGSNDLWINRRMIVSSDDAFPQYQEVRLDIKDSKGTVYPYACKTRSGAAEVDQYIVLKAGAWTSHKESMSCFIAMSVPGAYTAIAHYRDGSTSPPPPPKGVPYLSEEIVSAAVNFEVVKKPTQKD